MSVARPASDRARSVLIEALALHPSPGGALRYAYETWPRLAHALAAHGGRLHVLLSQHKAWKDTACGHWRDAGAELHWTERPASTPWDRWRHGSGEVQRVLAALPPSQAGSISVLQTQSPVPLRRFPLRGFPLQEAPLGPALRRVQLCHGVRHLHTGLRAKRWLAGRALRQCVAQADAWISVSRALQEELQARFVALRGKPCWVASPGSEHASGPMPADWAPTHAVHWLGPAAPHKGGQTLAQACADLPASVELRWTVEAPDFERLCISHPGLAGRVQRFEPSALPPIAAPPASNIPVPPAYKHSVLVLPSELESFGIVALEALATGQPMVISDLPAHREVVGTAQGAVHWFAPGDANGLQRAVLAALEEPEPQTARSMRLERARAYSWDACVRVTLNAWGLASV